MRTPQTTRWGGPAAPPFACPKQADAFLGPATLLDLAPGADPHAAGLFLLQQDITRGRGMVDSLYQGGGGHGGTQNAILSSEEYLSQVQLWPPQQAYSVLGGSDKARPLAERAHARPGVGRCRQGGRRKQRTPSKSQLA